MLGITSTHTGDRYEVTYPCIWSVTESNGGLSIGTEDGYLSDLTEIVGIIMPQLSLLLTATSDISATVSEVSLSYYDDELNKCYYTADEYMKKNIASMLNTSNNYFQVEMVGEIEEAQVMGKAGKKVTLTLSAEEEVYGQFDIYYIPYNEEKLLTLTKACSETVNNTVYEEAMNKVIDSIKIVE